MLAHQATLVAAAAVAVVATFERTEATFGGARRTQTALQADLVGAALVRGDVFGTWVAGLAQELGGEKAHAHRFVGA